MTEAEPCDEATDDEFDARPMRRKVQAVRKLYRDGVDAPDLSKDQVVRSVWDDRYGSSVHKVGFPLCEHPYLPDLNDVADEVLVDELEFAAHWPYDWRWPHHCPQLAQRQTSRTTRNR